MAAGESSFGRTPSFLEKVFYLPEDFAGDNVVVEKYAMQTGQFYPNFSPDKFNRIISEFGVDPKAKFNKLSLGQQKKAIIAVALSLGTRVLLMDEPFGALDAQTRTQLQTELLKTWEEEKKTCFFITHDVEEAILLASRVVVMSARPGRIKEVIDIDIPYPRNQETKMLPRFTELKNYIWQNVYKEYLEVQK